MDSRAASPAFDKECRMFKRMSALSCSVLCALLVGCGGNDPTALNATQADTQGAVRFNMEAWADNWFAVYLGDSLLVEDSVPMATERSFNAESVAFRADYPLHLNFILKDYKEDDAGLEYIGRNNQQMGDGGFIMQLTDTASGEVVAVSNGDWACTVVHRAPLDKACERESNPTAGMAPCAFSDLGQPKGWKASDFDDGSWTSATVHSARAVRPKGGYDEIRWHPGAAIIWGPDLATDNTVLCRVVVPGSQDELG